jgi:hypothetical protein
MDQWQQMNQLKDLQSDIKAQNSVKKEVVVEKAFHEADHTQMAKADFIKVCEQSNLIASPNLKMLSVSSTFKKYCDVFPIAYDTRSKGAHIPREYIKLDDPKMYVGLVCYSGDRLLDIIMLNSAMFVGMSKYATYDQKLNEYTIRIKDITKEDVKQYSFAKVIAQL